ncbi:inositol polyphosphate 1-phosphatase-like [Haliotis rufescens]|uniref:inositol polyphosphate 1-phosphatase-like n=1 Tax=Haliotis rufescens TaxID=6454 RepID=UPI00201F0F89|nr:inositol polyphosphate 1-phosphatase-like [Haliotis rufescens]
MLLRDFTSALIAAAEKGAKVARIVRAENTLLQLLVQEKEGKEKNDRFVQDFKTLADVLIQEMVRHDLSLKFPGLEENVYGEESNCFTNTAGKSVVVQLCPTPQETASSLKEVLDGNEKAAAILSEALHEDVEATVDATLESQEQEVAVDDVGIWIDPIDSTAQFIRGQSGAPNNEGIVDEGLQCVTVLIGAFDKQSGQPIAGVCVQPFALWDTKTLQWLHNTTWSVCYKDVRLSSITPSKSHKHSIIISSSESDAVKQKLSKKFTLFSAAGAGYKILSAAWGHVDGYVLSRPTIYKWDCCAPHAVLLSLGGGIVPYTDLDTDLDTIKGADQPHQLQYQFSSNEGGNAVPGVIAYRTKDVLSDIIHCLKNGT